MERRSLSSGANGDIVDSVQPGGGGGGGHPWLLKKKVSLEGKSWPAKV